MKSLWTHVSTTKRKLTSKFFALREQMRSKFFRNLASFDSIDKMRLPRLSDSCKIYHIYAHNSLKVINKVCVQVGQSAILIFCVESRPLRSGCAHRCAFPEPFAIISSYKYIISPEGRYLSDGEI